MTYTLPDERTFAGVHPDEVREAAAALTYYGGDAGPKGDETVARVLFAALAWRLRQRAIERAHARRRDDALRLAEAAALLEQVRRRTRAHRSALEDVL